MRIEQALMNLLDKAKEQQKTVVRLEAKGMTLSDLENVVGTSELFTQEKTVILGGLFSLPKSKTKDSLMTWLSEYSNDTIQVICTESKVLTPAAIKKFPKAKVEVYKLPALLFNWVEKLGVAPTSELISTFHVLLKTQDAEFIFAMICRQIRQLLLYKSDGLYEGPPFGRNKISSQANKFTLEKLLGIHEKLLKIDLHQKTSSSPLTLSQEIDLLVASM